MTQNVVTCTFDFISCAYPSQFLFIGDVKKKKDTSTILILLIYLFRQKDKLRESMFDNMSLLYNQVSSSTTQQYLQLVIRLTL